MAGPAKPLWVVLAGAMLAACAQPTPYQPADGSYGYSQQQIEENRYRVSFAGNMVTPRDTVQNYLLYRAAELTLETGHDYFTLADQDLQRSTTYHGTGSSTVGYRSRFDQFDPAFGMGFGSYTAVPVDSYTAIADIVLSDGTKPADNPNAYDARDVLRQLDPTVVRAPGVMRVIPPAEQAAEPPTEGQQ